MSSEIGAINTTQSFNAAPPTASAPGLVRQAVAGALGDNGQDTAMAAQINQQIAAQQQNESTIAAREAAGKTPAPMVSAISRQIDAEQQNEATIAAREAAGNTPAPMGSAISRQIDAEQQSEATIAARKG
jgi:hypothetical protein